jgi:threonine-phosphate decarboxylase
MIEGHGDDGWKYTTTIRADFSSNVWYGGLDPDLQAHLQQQIASVTHYPEVGAQSLQVAAAGAYGVSPDNMLATNGATEAIYLAAQAFRHQKIATIFTPAFAEYADACGLYGLDIRLQPWDDLTTMDGQPEGTDLPPEGLVFICNPNNPTGTALPLARLQNVIHHHPRTLFVIDESYIEFTRSTQTLLPCLADHPNLLLLRSLTKSYRIPGLRIGFAIGHDHLIRQLRAAKMPWSVNRLAIEAGLYIFRNYPRFTLPLDQLLAATASWRRQLQEATGWLVHETDTHYFLIDTRGSAPCRTGGAALTSGARPTSAADLKLHLIQHYGLLIRDASNFESLTPFHFRIACQSSEHNQFLTDALRQCTRTGI